MSFPARRDPELEPAAIRAGLARIHPAFRASPQYEHDGLGARAGIPVVLKVETVNPIRAFKGRGTWLAIEGLAGEGRVGPERAVVAASTGNFGQGVAFAARAFDIPAVVFADERANPVKLERIRGFGARVVQQGRDFDAAREAAAAFAQAEGGHLLVDGQDPRIAAGAATIAVELTDAISAGSLPHLATAYIPLGNGALIVGIGAWLRHASPDTRIVGVAAKGAPSMVRSWEAQAVIETAEAATYAEGIACRVPVPEALEMMVGRIDDLLLVSEEQLHAAEAELRAATGITVEGAAAASWAGLLADQRRAGHDREGAALVLVTGSNVSA
ncbi:MAG TPA: pyridoxal-phosphate dependent enzyme [Candidatus Eisenbacteria bacterium]|nr:pyridoxal-phosphate dependent enzyme [Candidatus Eisenbacteria bacterium]